MIVSPVALLVHLLLLMCSCCGVLACRLPLVIESMLQEGVAAERRAIYSVLLTAVPFVCSAAAQ
jgi:hypothetical protein